MNELYNKHYIRIDVRGRILDGWSDGPHPEKSIGQAVCVNQQGGYQFQLCGKKNPMLLTIDDIPLYRWDGDEASPRTEEEIDSDRQTLTQPDPSSTLESRVETLETETAAISAAIERGLSL